MYLVFCPLTSGAIQGNVPARDILVVLPINLEAPKSHNCKYNNKLKLKHYRNSHYMS